MALELNAREIDALCLQLQQLIRSTRMCDAMTALGGQISFFIFSSQAREDSTLFLRSARLPSMPLSRISRTISFEFQSAHRLLLPSDE